MQSIYLIDTYVYGMSKDPVRENKRLNVKI